VAVSDNLIDVFRWKPWTHDHLLGWPTSIFKSLWWVQVGRWAWRGSCCHGNLTFVVRHGCSERARLFWVV